VSTRTLISATEFDRLEPPDELRYELDERSADRDGEAALPTPQSDCNEDDSLPPCVSGQEPHRRGPDIGQFVRAQP